MGDKTVGAGEDEEDLTGVMWNDKVWLSCFPLNANTALEYFSMSQFYDRSCNNELIKMQRLDPSLLQTMSGVEYALDANPSPGLFIIGKWRRGANNPSARERLATYYIADGNVYQAPTAHAVLSSRILQSIHHLRAAFEKTRDEALLRADGKYEWKTKPGIPADDVALSEKFAAENTPSMLEKRAIDGVLYEVLHKNRAIDAARQAEAANSAQKNENLEAESQGAVPNGKMHTEQAEGATL